MTDNESMNALECCSSSNTKMTEKKIKAIYPHIVVCGSTDNPYYCIDWYDIETKEMIRGYGSYNLAFVRMWLESDFEIVDEDIIDLINRPKAEIENWKKACDELFEQMSKRLEMEKDIAWLYGERLGKSKTIKEFEERLKILFIPQKADGYTREIVLKRDIDNLIENMREEINA